MNSKSAKTLGQIVREARKKKGLTQEDLGKKLGVHPSWVSKVERNKGLPGSRMKESLKSILGVDLPEPESKPKVESQAEIVMRITKKMSWLMRVAGKHAIDVEQAVDLGISFIEGKISLTDQLA